MPRDDDRRSRRRKKSTSSSSETSRQAEKEKEKGKRRAREKRKARSTSSSSRSASSSKKAKRRKKDKEGKSKSSKTRKKKDSNDDADRKTSKDGDRKSSKDVDKMMAEIKRRAEERKKRDDGITADKNTLKEAFAEVIAQAPSEQLEEGEWRSDDGEVTNMQCKNGVQLRLDDDMQSKEEGEEDAVDEEGELEKQHEEKNREEEEEERRRIEAAMLEEKMLQRQAEEKRKIEEVLQTRRAQQATIAVLEVLTKLAKAQPEDFESLRALYQRVLVKELPHTGKQLELLQREAGRVLDHATSYVSLVLEQRRRYESWEQKYPARLQQKELAAQRRRAQKDQEALHYVRELEEKVNFAEKSVQTAMSSVQSLVSFDGAVSDAITKTVQAVEEAASNAMTNCSTCTEFIQSKLSDLEGADGARPEVDRTLARLSPRIQDALRMATEAFNRARAIGEKLAKKAATMRFEEKRNKLFAKYDADGDGFLNRDEICAYALGEFNFVLPGDTLDEIWRTLSPSSTSVGLPNTQFARLRTAIELAKEQQIAAGRCDATHAKSKPPQPLLVVGTQPVGTTAIGVPLMQTALQLPQLPQGLTLTPEQIAQAVALANSGAMTPVTGPMGSLTGLSALGSLTGIPRGI